MSNDVVRRTEALVAVDTAPGLSTAPLVGLVAEELSALGADVRVQDGEHAGVSQRNLIARFGGHGPAGLVLAGHLDTVPWEAQNRATVRPERDGRTLYGRGTCDMKGAVAAQIEAAAACCEALARPLVLCWTYAEEVGCHGALHLVAQRELVGDVSQAVCIVGEPTGLVPGIAHKGYGVAAIHLHGKPAHSSDPGDGADASQVLGALLAQLHALRNRLQSEAGDTGHQPPGTTLNTGLVSAGTARNVVPDRATVSLEFRPLAGTDMVAFRARVAACLERALAVVEGVTGEIDWYEDRPPFAQDAADPFVRWLVERSGHDPCLLRFYTEAELYRTGFSIPTAVCGPGSIDQAHRVDECVEFDALEAGVAFYADAIEAFCR